MGKLFTKGGISVKIEATKRNNIRVVERSTTVRKFERVTSIVSTGSFVAGTNIDDITFFLNGRVFSCDRSADALYELNPVTLAIINQNVSLDEIYKCGSTDDRLYASKVNANVEWEFNPDTLVIINTGNQNCQYGIGGFGSRLFSQRNDDIPREINPDTFAEINSGVAYDTNAEGIDGAGGDLYGIGDTSNRLHKIDPDTLVSLEFVGSVSLSPSGVGVFNDEVLDLLINDLVEQKTASELRKIVYDSTDFEEV